MRSTLAEVARSEGSTSLAAAALIEAGLSPSTRIADLTPASVVRTLVEAVGAELARAHEQLEEVYESAFLDTGTGESVARLVEQLERARPWWRRLLLPPLHR